MIIFLSALVGSCPTDYMDDTDSLSAEVGTCPTDDTDKHWFFICAICVFCVGLFLARRFRG